MIMVGQCDSYQSNSKYIKFTQHFGFPLFNTLIDVLTVNVLIVNQPTATKSRNRRSPAWNISKSTSLEALNKPEFDKLVMEANSLFWYFDKVPTNGPTETTEPMGPTGVWG